MNSPWDELWHDIDSLRQNVSRIKTINVNISTLRNEAASVVQKYFRLVRPELEKIDVSETLLEATDYQMQELLRLSQGYNPKNSYSRVLNFIRSIRTDLAGQREINIGKIGDSSKYSENESQIIKTLEAMLPQSAISYKQVLIDLKDSRRISWRGSAAELREVMREVLDYLAPDESVAAAPGFKLEKDQKGPTMKQKATFILKSRQLPESSRKGPQDLTNLIDSTTATFVRSTYTRGSVSSHVPPSKEEIARLKRYADNVLMELLEAKQGS